MIPDSCTPLCGDGIKVGYELYDDGSNDGFGANSNCTAPLPGFYCYESDPDVPNECFTQCGDGLVAGHETCDILYTSDEGCLNQPSCIGSEPGWACVGGDSGTPSVCTEICGDGVLTKNEECDDGDGLRAVPDEESLLNGCSNECLVVEGWECHSALGSTSRCNKICGNFE